MKNTGNGKFPMNGKNPRNEKTRENLVMGETNCLTLKIPWFMPMMNQRDNNQLFLEIRNIANCQNNIISIYNKVE